VIILTVRRRNLIPGTSSLPSRARIMKEIEVYQDEGWVWNSSTTTTQLARMPTLAPTPTPTQMFHLHHRRQSHISYRRISYQHTLKERMLIDRSHDHHCHPPPWSPQRANDVRNMRSLNQRRRVPLFVVLLHSDHYQCPQEPTPLTDRSQIHPPSGRSTFPRRRIRTRLRRCLRQRLGNDRLRQRSGKRLSKRLKE
jgi:hypothetical protein